MKKLLLPLVCVLFFLSGCYSPADLKRISKDRKIKSIGYLCETQEETHIEKKNGDESKVIVKKTKDDKNFNPKILNFLFAEYRAPLFSKREWDEVFYTLTQIEGFKKQLTINVWPKSEGFTSVKRIKNGYEAYTKNEDKTLRHNREAVEADEAFIGGVMLDWYADKETYLKTITDEKFLEQVKKIIENTEFPRKDIIEFRLNRVSGEFYLKSWKAFGLGREKTISDAASVSFTSHTGACRPSMNL